jgi:hypothetical protein
MSEEIGTICVEEVQEHDDGSATYTMLMDDKSRQLVINEGIRLVFNCAAYGVDLEDVYDWIASHKEEKHEESSEYGNYGENNPPLGDTSVYD